jgi:hypothetical protein
VRDNALVEVVVCQGSRAALGPLDFVLVAKCEQVSIDFKKLAEFKPTRGCNTLADRAVAADDCVLLVNGRGQLDFVAIRLAVAAALISL